MNHNESTKTILSFGKNIFRELHKQYGFDFEKDIGIFRVDGPFTVNSIAKMVVARGFSKGATCVVLTTDEYTLEHRDQCIHNELDIAHLWLASGKFDTPILYTLGTYWRKSDFNEVRRLSSAVSFVIAQDNTAHRKWKSVDYLQRYHVAKVNRRDTKEILSLDLIGEDGDKILYNMYYEEGENKNVREIIDGSGYLVAEHRRDLERRLKAMKEQKAKSAYATTDNSDKVVTVDALLSARKAILAQAFASASTYEELGNFQSKLCDYRNALYEAERFKQNTKNKSYGSIEESDRVYNCLVKTLTA